MHSSPPETAETLIIQENSTCILGDLEIEIQIHLGSFADVHYFKVILKEESKIGLLRVGSVKGGLQREMELREILGERKMVSKLLISERKESVTLSLGPETEEEPATEEIREEEISTVKLEDSEDVIPTTQESEEESLEEEESSEGESLEGEYLEEESYPEKQIGLEGVESSSEKLLLLSYFPNEEETLATWLEQDNDLESSLLLASQICQFCRYVHEREWCLISILPQFSQFSNIGKPIQFFDLTTAYPVGTKLDNGFINDYCAPELLYSNVVTEEMSTYVVGAVLYQALHHKLPPRSDGIASPTEELDLEIQKIPRIYQILSISLAPIPEERFPLSQLVHLLVKTRQSLSTSKVRWETASDSTVGLSPSRLENEDNYGISQPSASNSDSLILAVVADGMGGMAQGEVASKLAVQTVLNANLPREVTTAEQRAQWLISLVEQANQRVSQEVKNGGTTLSIVLAVERELNMAHVGDSRIFLLRQGILCQLSEDHSMVAMLLASGQITYEDSIHHPDRSVLVKSIGSKPRLSRGYVQDLSRFGRDFSLTLEDGDILILCSDGVWDLISVEDLGEIFTKQTNLQTAVEQTIQQVLERGANDNATIVALKCSLESNSF